MVLTASIAGSFPVLAQDEHWQAITGSDTLNEFMSGAIAEKKRPDGTVNRSEYFADGSGIVHEYGASFPRTGKTKGSDQICISAPRGQLCFTLEQNTVESDLYRGRFILTV